MTSSRTKDNEQNDIMPNPTKSTSLSVFFCVRNKINGIIKINQNQTNPELSRDFTIHRKVTHNLARHILKKSLEIRAKLEARIQAHYKIIRKMQNAKSTDHYKH